MDSGKGRPTDAGAPSARMDSQMPSPHNEGLKYCNVPMERTGGSGPIHCSCRFSLTLIEVLILFFYLPIEICSIFSLCRQGRSTERADGAFPRETGPGR